MIAHTRNNAVATHQGESYLGFRLLVDRAQGRALNVSYWDNLDEATLNDSGPITDPPAGAETTVVRTNLYEMSIDAA